MCAEIFNQLKSRRYHVIYNVTPLNFTISFSLRTGASYVCTLYNEALEADVVEMKPEAIAGK